MIYVVASLAITAGIVAGVWALAGYVAFERAGRRKDCACPEYVGGFFCWRGIWRCEVCRGKRGVR